MRKPFDPELYDADDDAKYQVIGWLERKGFTAWVNPDKYGIDVLGQHRNIDYGFEVEVKHNWSGVKFPFDTVHFAERKLKFCVGNSFFTMLNNERDRLLITSGDVLLGSPVVTKDTKYTSGERFVAVPRARFISANLN